MRHRQRHLLAIVFWPQDVRAFWGSMVDSLLAASGSPGLTPNIPFKKVVGCQTGRTLFTVTNLWLGWLPNTEATGFLSPCQVKGSQLPCVYFCLFWNCAFLYHLFVIWRSHSPTTLLRVNRTGPSLLSPNINNPKTQFIINKLKAYFFYFSILNESESCQSIYKEKQLPICSSNYS